jgi:hypothetical protein
MLIYIFAVMVDIAYRWAAEVTPICTNYPDADGFIIAIKNEIIMGIEFPIIFQEGLKKECLKKPGRVADMPLRRTDVNNRLNDIVLLFQRAANELRP